MNYRFVSKLLGIVSALIGVTMVFSLPWAHPALGVRRGLELNHGFETRAFVSLILSTAISGGVGYQTEAFDGLLGGAVNWGRPNENTFGPGLDDQLALEVFYRASVGRRGAVTIDLQYINDPAINPSESSIWMFNLRGRVAF